MVEDLFKVKDFEKKEQEVRSHYEAAYRVKLKKNLTPQEIDVLYMNLEKLRGTEWIYQKPKS
jgi:hypothetical protein